MRVYLTGAEAHAAYRQSHDGSLGSYRSSVRLQDLSFYRIQAISNIRIDHVAGYNGVGLGYITVAGDDSITWTAPGETTPGTAVTIANGETKQVIGNTAGKFIVVTRTSAAALAGAETVQLMRTANNVVGGSNFSDAESTSGEQKVRAVMFANMHASLGITGLKVWGTSPMSETKRVLSFINEAPTANQITDKTVDGETSVPTGLGTWVNPTTEGTGLSLGDLAVGAQMGLWISHTVAAGVAASAHWLLELNWSYTVDGTKYYGKASGVARIANDDYERYDVYRAADADPDITGTPWQTFTSSPLSHAPDDPAIGGATAYHFRVVRRNKYGLGAPDNKIYKFNVAALGELPSAPSVVTVTPQGSGLALIQAQYLPFQDGDHRGTYWRIYVSYDGTEPDPAVDTPISQAMDTYDQTQILQYTTTSGQLEDTPIKVLVRTAWKSGSTYYESTNTASVTDYAEWFGPLRPDALLSYNRALGHHEDMGIDGPADVVTYVDQAKNIYFKQGEGYLQFWADTVLLFNVKYDGTTLDTNGLYTTYALKQATVSGAAASTIEVAEWDTQKTIYVGVNGTRRLKIDVTAGTLTIGPMKQGAANVSTTRSDDPYWPKYGHTCFQVWDKAYMRYTTALSVASDQTFGMLVPFRQKATQAECL